MNISLSELKAFSKLASSIKGNNVLPILDYVKTGNGKIIKSSLHSFVTLDCTEAKTEMLINEHLLSVKVSMTSAPCLKITQKGNKVTLTDSITPTTFQSPELNTFPAIPEPTSKRFPVSENFMRVLRLAQNFPRNPEATNLSWMSFIMIGNHHICASNGHALFVEPIEEEFDLVLNKTNAAIISKFDIKSYAESDSYQFFYTSNSIIGFSKQEIPFTNIIKYADTSAAPLEFVGSASDFQKFNDECAQSSNVPWVVMTDKKVSMNDPNFDISLEREMPSVHPSEQFTYNPNTMNTILDVIDGDEVEFYKGKDWYWLKSPNQKSTMLIMRIMESEPAQE